jgi:transcription termination/antitermination protein NusG
VINDTRQFDGDGVLDSIIPIAQDAQWFAVHVKVRYEKFVAEMLREKGFETFAPLYRHKRYYGKVVKESHLPLFPGYAFCRLNPSNRLPVLLTPGVIKLLGNGKTPYPVDEGEISALQRAAQARVPMTPFGYLRSGEMGHIARGPLAGLEGVVVQEKRSFRLVLSVTLLQRSVMLEVDSADVVPCAPTVLAIAGSGTDLVSQYAQTL